MTTIIVVILMFGVLIGIHEFGHLIAAKKSGVKVNEFALGMGPKIYSKQKGETLYSLRLLPIGGFCAMEGEDDESDHERSFGKASYPRKIIIIVAGSICNFLLAIIIMIGVVMYIGTPSTEVESVVQGGPADTAGIMAGDIILQVDNSEIGKWEDLGVAIEENTSGKAEVVVDRDGKEITYTTEITKEDGRSIIGVTSKLEKNILTAIPLGIESTWNLATSMLDVLKQLFTGQVGIDQLTGPIGIGFVVDETLNIGLVNFFYLVAMISLNLGIINMLPLPALDGGRLLFIIINMITGKAVSDKVEGTIHLVGMSLLLLLALYIAGQDIIRFVLPN